MVPQRNNQSYLSPATFFTAMNISYNTEPTDHSPSASPSDPASPQNNNDLERIRSLRSSLGVSDDVPTEVLRAILEANDREQAQQQGGNDSAVNVSGGAESNIRQSEEVNNNDDDQRQRVHDANTAQTTIAATTTTTTTHRPQRKWDTCQNAPSRPGIISIDTTGNNFIPNDIGTVDEIAIYSHRVDAIHLIQENLRRRRTLSSPLLQSLERKDMEAMQRIEQEGERQMNELPVLRPERMVWNVPEEGRDWGRTERFVPPPTEEPLPLPPCLTTIDENMKNHHLCMGIYVDSGEEEEYKRDSGWGSSSISMDTSPMGPEEHVVRCYECRAGLRVHVSTGLVVCPRCRKISPAAEVV